MYPDPKTKDWVLTNENEIIGYFPSSLFYFDFVTYQNAFRKDYGPDKVLAQIISDKPNCFSGKYDGDGGWRVGCSLQFGGPGGKCDD